MLYRSKACSQWLPHIPFKGEKTRRQGEAVFAGRPDPNHRAGESGVGRKRQFAATTDATRMEITFTLPSKD